MRLCKNRMNNVNKSKVYSNAICSLPIMQDVDAVMKYARTYIDVEPVAM